MKNVSLGIVIACLVGSALQAYAQPPLPKEVQADMLVGRIEAAVEAGNAGEALASLAEYRKLGAKMPSALLYLEGRLAAISKDYLRSQRVILQYLSLPEARSEKNYQAALALYADVERKIRDDRKRTERDLMASMNPECVAFQAAAKQIVERKVPRSEFQECPFAPMMVIVPGGEFSMGTPDRNEWLVAKLLFGKTWPQRDVKIKTFSVGKYEVTMGEWMSCVESGGCNLYVPAGGILAKSLQNRLKLPVNQVSWNDAQSYVEWLSKQTGHRYRLLSEAEWEYAARAGSETPFNTGNSLSKRQANINGSSLVEVGNYPANKFGIHDVHGNVIEWVQDCWNPNFLGAPLDNSAWEEAVALDDVQPASCEKRVSRGGAYFLEAEHDNLNKRGSHSLGERHPNWGFRIARDLD